MKHFASGIGTLQSCLSDNNQSYTSVFQLSSKCQHETRLISRTARKDISGRLNLSGYLGLLILLYTRKQKTRHVTSLRGGVCTLKDWFGGTSEELFFATRLTCLRSLIRTFYYRHAYTKCILLNTALNYKNTPIQINWKFYSQKRQIFR